MRNLKEYFIKTKKITILIINTLYEFLEMKFKILTKDTKLGFEFITIVQTRQCSC